MCIVIYDIKSGLFLQSLICIFWANKALLRISVNCFIFLHTSLSLTRLELWVDQQTITLLYGMDDMQSQSIYLLINKLVRNLQSNRRSSRRTRRPQATGCGEACAVCIPNKICRKELYLLTYLQKYV